jgi:hypothetical protein
MTNPHAQLLAWAASHGARINNIEIRSTAHGNGLFAHITSPGKPRLSIPSSLVISLDGIGDEVSDDTEFMDVIGCLPETLPTLDIIHILYLLYQVHLKRDGRPGKWDLYLESFPRESLVPTSWTTEEVALLLETKVSIARPVEEKISYLRELWSRLVAGGGWFATVTWEEYRLAASWVSSRTFGKTEEDHVLVPVIDMANHSSAPTAAWITDSDGMWLVMPREPKEGQEICIAYDVERSVSERVYKYGFIEDRSMHGISQAMTFIAKSGKEFRVQEKAMRNGKYDFSVHPDWYYPPSTQCP